MSAIFITFAGNCKKALSLYQTVFGGTLQFETFENAIPGFPELPVVSASLVSERVIIHGSDLVHHEGRKLGNYISVFLHCKNAEDRKELIEKLQFQKMNPINKNYDQKLVEITDAFDVRWILSIS